MKRRFTESAVEDRLTCVCGRSYPSDRTLKGHLTKSKDCVLRKAESLLASSSRGVGEERQFSGSAPDGPESPAREACPAALDDLLPDNCANQPFQGAEAPQVVGRQLLSALASQPEVQGTGTEPGLSESESLSDLELTDSDEEELPAARLTPAELAVYPAALRLPASLGGPLLKTVAAPTFDPNQLRCKDLKALKELVNPDQVCFNTLVPVMNEWRNVSRSRQHREHKSRNAEICRAWAGV